MSAWINTGRECEHRMFSWWVYENVVGVRFAGDLLGTLITDANDRQGSTARKNAAAFLGKKYSEVRVRYQGGEHSPGKEKWKWRGV